MGITSTILDFYVHVDGVAASEIALAGHAADQTVDVCVYGGIASGGIAAVLAAQDGRRVLLVEPSRHLGGMTGGGIGNIADGAAPTAGSLTPSLLPGTSPEPGRIRAGWNRDWGSWWSG